VANPERTEVSMSDITDARRRLLRLDQRRDPLVGLTKALDHYQPVAREAVRDQYARLGREARQGKAMLRADHLVQGDAVLLDGDCLIVELASFNETFVALAFVGWPDYGLTVERDRMVPVLHTVDCDAADGRACVSNPVAAVERLDAIKRLETSIADQQFADRSVAERRASSPWQQHTETQGNLHLRAS
jgi:hypothetical protein